MRAKVISIASVVGAERNNHGASVEPGRDEIDLATEVALAALDKMPATISLDSIVFASSGIRQFFPSVAIEIARRIGLNCLAYDVTAACASMGIAIGIAADSGKNSLVVSADCMSRTVDPLDPSHKPLRSFADGAAAVVIGFGDSPGLSIIAHQAITCGKWGRFYKSMNGRIVRSLPSSAKTHLRDTYVESWQQIGKNLLQHRESIEGATWIYVNQGDLAIVPRISKSLGIPESQIILTDHGHAGGADPWIGVDTNSLAEGDSAIMLSSGIGFEFHGILLEHLCCTKHLGPSSNHQ